MLSSREEHMQDDLIDSVTDFLSLTENHATEKWTKKRLLALKSPDGSRFPDRADIDRILNTRWFRGQSRNHPLVPKVYRNKYDEQEMLLQVRRQAALMPEAPTERETVYWYFTLQHHGFPTRLLDWTESALVALFFAVEKWAEYSQQKRKMSPIVWMINPFALNWALRKSSIIPGTGGDEGIYDGAGEVHMGVGSSDIEAAWSGAKAEKLPLAIASTYVHVRMQVQSSRFTVHGHSRTDLRKLFVKSRLLDTGFVKPFRIDPRVAQELFHKLQKIGISRSMLFPGLDSISRQFDESYRLK
jgi:hypothetical protein